MVLTGPFDVVRGIVVLGRLAQTCCRRGRPDDRSRWWNATVAQSPKVVLITKSLKEQDGYEGTLDRGSRWTPVWRPHRTRSGVRHTAFAAKNDLEKTQGDFKGTAGNFVAACPPDEGRWRTLEVSQTPGQGAKRLRHRIDGIWASAGNRLPEGKSFSVTSISPEVATMWIGGQRSRNCGG